MTAPRPKRLDRTERLRRQAIVRREESRNTEIERRRTKNGPRRASAGKALPDTVEAALQNRAGGRCELCGQPLRDRCQRHHRKLRSQGGRDDVVNLVLLHPNCHHTVHMNPLWAKDNGWIVPAPRNPATVAIVLHDTRPVRLTAAGTYQAAA